MIWLWISIYKCSLRCYQSRVRRTQLRRKLELPPPFGRSLPPGLGGRKAQSPQRFLTLYLTLAISIISQHLSSYSPLLTTHALNRAMPPKRVSQISANSSSVPPVPKSPSSSSSSTTGISKSSFSSSKFSSTQTAQDVLQNLWQHYRSRTPQRVKLIDAFMAFLVAVGVLQFVYCVLVGNYVGFLFGFLSCYFGIFLVRSFVGRCGELGALGEKSCTYM